MSPHWRALEKIAENRTSRGSAERSGAWARISLAEPMSAVPPSTSSDPLEDTPYRTVGTLGRGGMGEILDAEHRALGRRVAVKILHRHLVTREALERFRLEGQALARLDDPHLVVVTDCGETTRGVPYFVMERLAGRTLRQELLKRGALPWREAIELFLEVLAGLVVLHRAGIVHRDLKPGNIFLCEHPDGARSVKLLDLGIAKILSGASARIGLRAPEQALTQGMAVGTPQYMAPEQARGGDIDARTDLYAAGSLLFKMLTGRSPFEHCRDFPSLAAAQEEPIPSPSSVAPRPIGRPLDTIVLRALAFDPEDRFASVDELAAALRAALLSTEAAPLAAIEEQWFAQASTVRLDAMDPGVDARDAATQHVIPARRQTVPIELSFPWLRVLVVGLLAAAVSALCTLAVVLAAAR